MKKILYLTAIFSAYNANATDDSAAEDKQTKPTTIAATMEGGAEKEDKTTDTVDLKWSGEFMLKNGTKIVRLSNGLFQVPGRKRLVENFSSRNLGGVGLQPDKAVSLHSQMEEEEVREKLKPFLWVPKKEEVKEVKKSDKEDSKTASSTQFGKEGLAKDSKETFKAESGKEEEKDQHNK